MSFPSHKEQANFNTDLSVYAVCIVDALNDLFNYI